MATESFKFQSEKTFGIMPQGYRLFYSLIAVITLSLVLEIHDSLFPDVRGLISCVAVTLYVVVGIKPEEAELVKQFGAAYTLYRQTTPALLPRFFLHK